MVWLNANWPYVSLVLLGISEFLGAMPSIQVNGIADAAIKAIIAALVPKVQANLPPVDKKP